MHVEVDGTQRHRIIVTAGPVPRPRRAGPRGLLLCVMAPRLTLARLTQARPTLVRLTLARLIQVPLAPPGPQDRPRERRGGRQPPQAGRRNGDRAGRTPSSTPPRMAAGC